MDRRLKITLIILLIILLSMISFAGIFVQKGKNMENIVPEYKLGMDLRGYRAVTLSPSSETETVYYDKDGNVKEFIASTPDDYSGFDLRFYTNNPNLTPTIYISDVKMEPYQE